MVVQEIASTSCEVPSGGRVLRHEVVNGSLEEVCSAFTAEEGLRSWMTPLVKIDFRMVGIIETCYDPAASIGDPGNIQIEILSFLPMEMLFLQTVRPAKGTPFTDLVTQTCGIYQFQDLCNSRVKVIAAGFYKQGEDWEQILRRTVAAVSYSQNRSGNPKSSSPPISERRVGYARA